MPAGLLLLCLLLSISWLTVEAGVRSAPPACCIAGADGQPSPCRSARLLAFQPGSNVEGCDSFCNACHCGRLGGVDCLTSGSRPLRAAGATAGQSRIALRKRECHRRRATLWVVFRPRRFVSSGAWCERPRDARLLTLVRR
jgi:hypothetical protein